MKKKKTKTEEFDYQSFEKEAIQKLRDGNGLTGKEGALTGLIKRILDAALEEEMDAQLPGLKSKHPENRRNGHTSKVVKTALGKVSINPPRDRKGEFEPKIIGKWDRSLAPELEKQILTLYGIGTSYSDIRAHLNEMYDVNYSEAVISKITDRVIDEIAIWSIFGCDPLSSKRRRTSNNKSSLLSNGCGIRRRERCFRLIHWSC